MTNKPRGVLNVGVTADLASRVMQHRDGKGSAFCRRYNLTMLVHAEPHVAIEQAIVREKALKAWKREWNIELIERSNPSGEIFSSICPRPPETPAFAGVTRG